MKSVGIFETKRMNARTVRTGKPVHVIFSEKCISLVLILLVSISLALTSLVVGENLVRN